MDIFRSPDKVLKLARRAKNKIRHYKANAVKELRLRQRLLSARRGDKQTRLTTLNRGVLNFLDSLNLKDDPWIYRYSLECDQPTLYASAYACMLKSMLGSLTTSPKDRTQWANYFDSFQNPDDGLFYDPVVSNPIFEDSDWWGARHLTLHMISAYTALGKIPKSQFGFLSKYYNKKLIDDWLSESDWNSFEIAVDDIDNKLMNIGCLLQYQRDIWNDSEAAMAVEYIKKSLRSRINPSLGVWGVIDIENPCERSRIVQFAYHLLPIYFYDKDFDFDCERIARLVLNTQNRLGGFGVPTNSSACEDIDSVYLLIKLFPFSSPSTKEQIRLSLNKAYLWILSNQVNDGGFVFRLLESFVYGSDQMSSLSNQGALFPTWFRMLSIAYLVNFIEEKEVYNIARAPGLVF